MDWNGYYLVMSTRWNTCMTAKHDYSVSFETQMTSTTQVWLLSTENKLTTFKSCYGRYLCSKRSVSKLIGDSVVADREKADVWESLEIIKLTERQHIIKTSNGKYLSVNSNGTIKTSKEVTINEKFEIIPFSA